MVELIKKDVLSEEIKSLSVNVTGLRAGKGVLSNYMKEYRNSVLRVIEEQQTTTEAEIRAKELNHFANWMYEKYGKDLTDYVEWYIAEQLKENEHERE